MREGDETITTSVPSIVGSKDPDASSSMVSREQSKETKDLNIDELADLIVTRLNPQAKNVAHRDNQEMRTCTLEETWYGAVYTQGIIAPMSV